MTIFIWAQASAQEGITTGGRYLNIDDVWCIDADGSGPPTFFTKANPGQSYYVEKDTMQVLADIAAAGVKFVRFTE